MLNKISLENDLLECFNNMKNDKSKQTNAYFSQSVAKAIKDFAEGGSITTSDSGGVPDGNFSGSGSGSLKLNSAILENALLNGCAKMDNMTSGGDDELVNVIKNALRDMTSGDVVETNVSGQAGSKALSGISKGTITCNTSTIVTELTNLFNQMKSTMQGGEALFASGLATSVFAYFNNASVRTVGQGSISGVIGTGKLK